MVSYRVEIDPEVRKAVRRLPGNFRQRVVRALKNLRQDPRPHASEELDLEKAEIRLDEQAEPRRIRMGAWRIIYVIEEDDQLVSVLAIRKRPPYQYEDLRALMEHVILSGADNGTK